MSARKPPPPLDPGDAVLLWIIVFVVTVVILGWALPFLQSMR